MPKSKKNSLLYWYPEPEPTESVWGLTSTDMPSREHTSTDKPSRNAEALSQAAKALFNNAKLSDVTINIHTQQGATKLSAHSFVLAAISPYFRRALEGKYAESESKEFTFDQDSPHAYWRVFEYMYTGDYSDDPAKMEAFEDEPDDEELARDVRVYCLAEYFDVDSLKTDASERNGEEVMALLLEQRGIEIMITEEMVTITALHFDEKLMALLLEQRGSEITITEEVVKAAAGNEGNGKEVMTLILEQRGDETAPFITEMTLLTAIICG
ncbi:hypothetical protein MY10362_009450 [Beauveria mimosiformis]